MIQDDFRKLGYTFFESTEKPYNLNIVGFRNKNARPNHFDDELSVYYIDRLVRRKVSWPITTYPGLPWLLKPMNPKGAAIMVPGQYRSAYILGRFRGVAALRQVKPVKVYRDRDLDGTFTLNPDTIEEGLFGLHIHRAGIWSKVVGLSSAGCQVFQRQKDFLEFIGLCQKAAANWGNKFTYTLMER